MSAPLWMPGAIRIPSSRRIRLNNNGYRLLTWHTFECPYSWTVEQALQFLLNQATEAFVFHPITGQWGQCQPMDTGARTLRAAGAVTNAFGTVHQQVEVIGYAGRPFTNDLTPAGRVGLARGLAFFRQWGIPDQWAWNGVTRPPATYAEMLRFPKRAPDRSGHAFHSGWNGGNMHWDPGAIEAPWVAAGSTTPPPPARPTPPTVDVGTDLEVTASGGLNARTGPGEQHERVGAAPHRARLTATGRTDGDWIEAYHHTRPDEHLTGWWHGAHLRAVGKPAAGVIKTMQGLLNDLGVPAEPLALDGVPGARTSAALTTYSTTYGYTGSRTAWAALTTHLEETMATLEEIKTQLDDLRRHVTARTAMRIRPATAALIGAEPDRAIPLEQALDLALRSAAQSSVHARRAEARGAALESALESLAGQTAGVDVEAVKAAARAGAEAALQEVRFDVAAASATRLDQEN